jgi:translation initiation factor 1
LSQNPARRYGRAVSTKPAPLANPFAALAGLRDDLPAGPEPAASPPAPASSAPARAVVRVERTGRRGKEVTVVDKLGLAAADLAEWTRELKQALGTGGAVEGAAIVVQGDHRARVAAWLEGRGVRRVTIA